MTKYHICNTCKEAPPRGQWRRSWRWKTQRGFDNHKCYADEEQIPQGSILHPDRNNGKVPSWLGDGEELPCPKCNGTFLYGGPQSASLHFSCPLCGEEVQFIAIGEWETQSTERVCSICGAEMVERTGKYGTFWGCSEYTRGNPCRGKAEVVSRQGFEDVLALEVFDDSSSEPGERAGMVEQWRARDERREQMAQSRFWR